ncbi:DUF6941 family protein [Actinophytocola sediminis]
MKVTVLLADSAQSDSATGKLHALGMGWTTTSAVTGPMAVITMVTFERQEEAAGTHSIGLTLVDEEYEPVAINPAGEHLTVKADVAVGAKGDTVEGAPAVASLAINVGPGLQLEPSKLYRWQASVNDGSAEEWSATFVTRPVQAPKE